MIDKLFKKSQWKHGPVMVCSALVVAVCCKSLNAQAQHSITNSGQQHAPIWIQPGKTIRLAIFDAFAAKPLKNTDVAIFCEGPISEQVVVPSAKVRPEGPTSGAHSWHGRTDGDGVLGVPHVALRGDCRVEANSFTSTYIHDACLQPLGPQQSLAWQIDLFPERLGKEGEFGTDGLKLVDGAGRPMAKVSVSIQFLVGGTLKAETNTRGFVFFGREKTFGRNAWITAPGYRRKTLDFDSGPLFEACGTTLEKQ